ncbi:DUF3622 domain-containing protein [Vibrio sp. 99-8-1]|uniref:DUF3622 domain-containing protein n=1 Tax=Vibrio sp. 99-8-1 TaxID=2607602 RepID=UPI001493BE05|nr:DUF3622 domain-containing protein [Vibrio sp. 99-8-1]NOI66557.1 DUF3622 domain-containing protein [Vibrio sp. 99-8-1]
MSSSKKFSYNVVEKRSGWTAEIVRQVSSKRSVVSKREMGFESEADAIAWAEKELPSFIALQADRNKRKSAMRKADQE